MFSANWNWEEVAPTNGKRRLIGPTIADICAGFKWQEQRWGPAGSFIAAILASSHVSQEQSPTKHFQIRKGRTLHSGSFGEEQSLFYPFSEPTAKASAEGATELSNRCLYSPTPQLSGIPHFLALESPIAWFNFKTISKRLCVFTDIRLIKYVSLNPLHSAMATRARATSHVENQVRES